MERDEVTLDVVGLEVVGDEVVQNIIGWKCLATSLDYMLLNWMWLEMMLD